MSESPATMLSFRRLLSARFGPAHVALSVDGRQVSLAAPVRSGATVDGLERDVPCFPIGVCARHPRCRPASTPRGFAVTRSCAASPDRARRTPPASCSNGCWRSTALPLVVLDPASDHVHLGALRHPDDPSDAAAASRAVAP